MTAELQTELPIGPCRLIAETDISWLAGLLEGEGCFHLRTDDGGVVLRLAMTDEDVIERAAGLMRATYTQQPRAADGWKDMFQIYVRGDRALNLMRMVLPYMGLRRSKQIKMLLEAA